MVRQLVLDTRPFWSGVTWFQLEDETSFEKVREVWRRRPGDEMTYQVDANTVQITETLVSGVEFVNTGAGDAIVFH